MTKTYVSIDWGGSNLRGICLEVGGSSKVFEFSSSNFRIIKEKELTKLCEDLYAFVSKFYSSPYKWFIGAAGAADEKSVSKLKSVLDKVAGSSQDIEFYPDFVCNHASVFGGRDGILSINGTGSILYAVNGNNSLRLGGWGFIFDEIPSGAYFGRKYLEGVLMGLEGYSDFESYALDCCNTDRKLALSQIISQVYSASSIQNHLGKYARKLTLAYENNEPFALRVINSSVSRLCESIGHMVERLGLKEASICGSGGLWERWKIFDRLVKEGCQNKGIQLIWKERKIPLYLGPICYCSTKSIELKEILKNLEQNKE